MRPKKSAHSRSNERGFSLPEVLVVLAITGILAAIAVPTLQGAIRDRQVDSAANQLAADLRLASTRAGNLLTDYTVVLPANSTTYQVGPSSRSLPERTRTGNPTSVTVTFRSDGTATSVPSGIQLTVGSSVDSSKTRTIDLNTQTSRIKVGT